MTNPDHYRQILDSDLSSGRKVCEILWTDNSYEAVSHDAMVALQTLTRQEVIKELEGLLQQLEGNFRKATSKENVDRRRGKIQMRTEIRQMIGRRVESLKGGSMSNNIVRH